MIICKRTGVACLLAAAVWRNNDIFRKCLWNNKRRQKRNVLQHIPSEKSI